MTKDAEIPTFHPIDVEFFSRRSNKSHQVINSTDPSEYIKGRSYWHRYDFTEPVYLTEIELETSGYQSWDSFHLRVEYCDGESREEQVKVNSGMVSLHLGKLATGFSFKPEKKYLSDPKINNLKVYGLYLDEFHRLEEEVRSIQKREKSVAAKEDRLSELEESIRTSRQELSEIETNIGRLEANSSQLEKNRVGAEEALQKSKDRLSLLERDIDTKTDERNAISDEIDEASRELRELTRELRLFPSEISGFVREGNRNIIWYCFLGLPFLIILYVLLSSMFSSAIDLTQVWRREPEVDIWTVFLTRLPFVLIALALVEGCAYVIGRLIYEVVRINRQRLEFAKISIIAKDVTVVAATIAETEEEDRFEAEQSLRMQLLRDHMKNYSEQDFSYRGNAIVSAIVSVANRFGKNESKEG